MLFANYRSLNSNDKEKSLTIAEAIRPIQSQQPIQKAEKTRSFHSKKSFTFFLLIFIFKKSHNILQQSPPCTFIRINFSYDGPEREREWVDLWMGLTLELSKDAFTHTQYTMYIIISTSLFEDLDMTMRMAQILLILLQLLMMMRIVNIYKWWLWKSYGNP